MLFLLPRKPDPPAVAHDKALPCRSVMVTLVLLNEACICAIPSETDFLDPVMAEELEDAYGGGDYSAIQRSALLQLAWDQVSSSLDARESVFQLHASGGMTAWRARLRSWFEDYNDLANGVQQFLSGDFPNLDFSGILYNSDEHSARIPSK